MLVCKTEAARYGQKPKKVSKELVEKGIQCLCMCLTMSDVCANDLTFQTLPNIAQHCKT